MNEIYAIGCSVMCFYVVGVANEPVYLGVVKGLSWPVILGVKAWNLFGRMFF
jgi:hypothetical protein